MDKLPNEIVKQILSYLDTQSLLKCMYVSKKFKHIIGECCHCLLCRILKKRNQIYKGCWFEDENFIICCTKNETKYYITMI